MKAALSHVGPAREAGVRCLAASCLELGPHCFPTMMTLDRVALSWALEVANIHTQSYLGVWGRMTA